jgi:hypothetical protein
MTQEDAKEYVMTHLPCTMTGVVAIFDAYFHGTVVVEKLVGMNARTLGYAKLVFYLRIPTYVDATKHKPTFLITCFHQWCAFHDFAVERSGFSKEPFGEYVAWIKPAIEIKEDRR